MAYDVNVKRVNKILKLCRKYLNWIQNSLFEGELTKSKLEKLKIALGNIINPEEDSIIFYTFRTTKYMEKEIMGVEKNNLSTFL